MTNVTTSANKSRVGSTTLEFRLGKSVKGTLASPGPAYRLVQEIDRAFIDAVFDEMMAKALPKAAALVSPVPVPEISPAWEAYEIVRRSIDVTSGKDWTQYWLHQDRLGRFNRLLDGVVEAMLRTHSIEDVHRSDERHVSVVNQVFPELEERLCFADATMQRSFSVVAQMFAVEVESDQARYEDAHHAHMFNTAYCWYRAALNALHVIARENLRERVPQNVIDQIAETLRESAVQAYHSALEGRRIRDEQDVAAAGIADDARATSEGSNDDDVFPDDDLADVEEYIEAFEAS